MKRISYIFICLILLFSFTACESKPRQIYLQYSKDGVPEFFKLAQEQEFDGPISALGFKEKNCYNVTPDIISEKTNYKIFKFSDNAQSYILIDGKVHKLGSSFDSCGFINALPCDFDEDGNIDILFSNVLTPSSSSISCFNTKTLKKQTIVTNEDFEDTQYHVILDCDQFLKTGKYTFFLSAEGYEPNNYIDMFYLRSKAVGEIVSQNKTSVYIKY